MKKLLIALLNAVQTAEGSVPAGEPKIFVVEAEDDTGGAAEDAAALDGAVITGIEAVVTVIAHHEVVAIGHEDWTEVAPSWN